MDSKSWLLFRLILLCLYKYGARLATTQDDHKHLVISLPEYTDLRDRQGHKIGFREIQSMFFDSARIAELEELAEMVILVRRTGERFTSEFSHLFLRNFGVNLLISLVNESDEFEEYDAFEVPNENGEVMG